MFCFSPTGAKLRASDDLDIIMQRLDAMDQKMTGLDEKITAISTGLGEKLDVKIAGLDEKITGVDAKITALDEKVEKPDCETETSVILNNNGVIGGKSGRLLIKYNGQWGTVCDDYVGQTDHVSDRPNE